MIEGREGPAGFAIVAIAAVGLTSGLILCPVHFDRYAATVPATSDAWT